MHIDYSLLQYKRENKIAYKFCVNISQSLCKILLCIVCSGGREGNGSPAVSGSGGSSRPAGSRSGDSSTLTAASLIDAIITHQINQTSNEGQTGQGAPGNTNSAQQQVTRPGDRLFQVCRTITCPMYYVCCDRP